MCASVLCDKTDLWRAGLTFYQVKRSAPTMIKDEKGRWVKPDKETLKRMKEEWEANQLKLQQSEEESTARFTSSHLTSLCLALTYDCMCDEMWKQTYSNSLGTIRPIVGIFILMQGIG